MPNTWPLVPLGDIASPVERPEIPTPGTNYRQVGVKLWGEGAYERESMDGAATRYRTLSRVEENDIVVNKIWARNGSVAVIPKALAGCYVSGEFPTFVPFPEKLEPRWFHWFTKTPQCRDQCDEKSRGTSGKNRIRPEEFLQIEIPLPPLDEQRRIVTRIEALAAKIEEACGLRHEVVREVDSLWVAALAESFSKQGDPPMALEDVCEAIIDNLHSTPTYSGDDFPCVRSQDVGWGTLEFAHALRVSESEFRERVRRGEPEKGDIVYVREGDIGRCAVVDGGQRFCLGQRVMILRPLKHTVDSHFLMSQLMSLTVLRDQVLSKKTGTTSHHVNIKHLRTVRVQVPPLMEQCRIVAYLHGLQAKVDALKKLQAETAAELDALLPSILDKAFRGEL